MNDPVIIKAAACVPVDVLLCTLLVFLVLLLQVFTCLSDIWPRASSCWANAGTFAVALIKKCFVCALCVSGYAHFIRGRQYWKFDPVNMNSLEGYPRYVGVDFFGCRNGRFWIWGSFWFFCNGVVSLFVCLVFWSKDIFIFGERFKGDESVSFESVYLSFIDTQIKYTFFSGKPSCIPSDLAPPVQLYSYLFCTFLSQ